MIKVHHCHRHLPSFKIHANSTISTNFSLQNFEQNQKVLGSGPGKQNPPPLLKNLNRLQTEHLSIFSYPHYIGPEPREKPYNTIVFM